jgi:hypothetical protein
VGAASSSIQDDMAAGGLARIQQGISVVSMSIDSPEPQSDTRIDPSLTTPADHTGITFVASAGDCGSFSIRQPTQAGVPPSSSEHPV